MEVKAFAVIPHSDVKGVSVEMEIKPIVLCKDCKHWFSPDDGRDDGRAHNCDLDALCRPGNWFCAGGEMKGEWV